LFLGDKNGNRVTEILSCYGEGHRLFPVWTEKKYSSTGLAIYKSKSDIPEAPVLRKRAYDNPDEVR